jgi:DNA-binding CsgD family transcriptional regulator
VTEVDSQAGEISAVASNPIDHDGSWLQSVIGLLDVATRQLHSNQEAAQSAIEQAALLLQGQMRAHLRQGPRASAETIRQPLTLRESNVLRLIAGGLSNKRIARHLDIAPETVKSHTKKIFAKLAAQTRAQAVAHGEVLGIIGATPAISRALGWSTDQPMNPATARLNSPGTSMFGK